MCGNTRSNFVRQNIQATGDATAATADADDDDDALRLLTLTDQTHKTNFCNCSDAPVRVVSISLSPILCTRSALIYYFGISFRS